MTTEEIAAAEAAYNAKRIADAASVEAARAAARAERAAKFASTAYKPYAPRPFTPRPASAPVAAQPVRKAWNEMTRKERLAVELAGVRNTLTAEDYDPGNIHDRYGR
jgi:hypothetical protein